ncbi:DUF2341 domain-containing protein, partial [candidate division WWE3 bacterium]|nr:DUF2341 domain-containing protein [candidate division WWE3 bacterium]
MMFRSRVKMPKQKRIISILAITLFSLLIVGVFFLSLDTAAQAGWWNDGWGYRVGVPVTNNTTAENNVYISFESGDAIDTSDLTKFQSDCGDLRFTTSGGVELPYYLASGCGTSTTVVHVNFDTFPAGDMVIYYYYGNASVENGSEASDFSTEA